MEEFIAQLRAAYRLLQSRKRQAFGRHVPFGDLVSERSEIAASYGFGEGTTCYDSVMILGNVTVGRNTWIGPNVILDGRGGLTIGDYVSLSAGVQIYTHDSVAWSISRGAMPMPHSPTTIGSGAYIGPNTVIQRGVEIGEGAVIGAMSYVDSSVPAGMKAWGVPARIIGSAPKVP
jgi:acetyltransferase-like isoleucine patch superfamily enzyme